MGNQGERGPAILQEGTILRGDPVILQPVDLPDIVVDPDFARNGANTTIAVVYQALNGAPGAPRTAETPDGLVEVAGGFYREYEHGRIYTTRGVGTFWVYGAIGARYAELGGPSSPLGWPTSTELDFAEGGRVTKFQKGAIYWWPDTDAIDLGNIALRYKGIVCFGETDWDQGSDEDEPYTILGVIPADLEQARTVASQIYGEVDAIESRGDQLDLFIGPPHGVIVTTTIMEHDFGSPEQARQVAAQGVEVGKDVVSVALEYVPYVGPILSKAAERAIEAAESDIAEAVSDLFDLHDDTIGRSNLTLSPKQLVTLTRAPQREFMGIGYRAESQLISGEGASYKAYFDVQPA